jgi:hypothetical protein
MRDETEDIRREPDVLVSEVGSDAGVLGSAGIFAFEGSGYSHITGGWLL